MINPSEISEVLKQQLESVNAQVSFEETGTVLEVGDGVAHVYGLDKVCANELVEFENGAKGVALNLEESNVGVILLNNVNAVTEGMKVKRTGEIASIPVGEGLFGRVINVLGEPIDGRGPIEGERLLMPLERKAPGVIYRQPVKQPLQTGLKAIDAMVPIGRGQRELIIGDRQIGKTAIAIDTIINQRQNFEAGKPVYCIYVAIGQKASSVAAIVDTLRRNGALDYTVVVAAGFRFRDDALFRTICRCCHRRIHSRHRPRRAHRLRRPFKAGCGIPRNIAHPQASFRPRGIPRRHLLSALPSP